MDTEITPISDLYLPCHVSEEGILLRARLRAVACLNRSIGLNLWVFRLHLIFADNTGILAMVHDIPQDAGKVEQQRQASTAISHFKLDAEYVIEYFSHHHELFRVTTLAPGTTLLHFILHILFN